MHTTRISTKGQVIVPKSIRLARGWETGLELTIEEAGDGILLRPTRRFPETRLDDVAGSLRAKGESSTVKQMNEAVTREAVRRHDSGRY